MIFTFPCIIFLYNTLPIQHVIYFTYLFGSQVNIYPLTVSMMSLARPSLALIVPTLITVVDTWKVLNRHLLNKSAVCLFWVLCDCLPFGISVSHLLRVMWRVWQNAFVAITCGLEPKRKLHLSCTGNYSTSFTAWLNILTLPWREQEHSHDHSPDLQKALSPIPQGSCRCIR